MIITCPSCTARFTVDDAALSPSGRKVKCSKCGNIWLQLPVPAEDAPPLPAPSVAEPEPEPVRERLPDPPAARARTRRPPPARAARRSSGAGMWLLFLVVLAGVLGGGYFYRGEIMAALPATKTLYAAVGLGPESPYAGLDLVDVSWKQETSSGGTNVLRITGKVINKGASPKEVPELAGVLYDDQDNALHSWTFRAPEPRRLLPSEDVAFNTQVANPDAKAARLTIKFSEAAARTH